MKNVVGQVVRKADFWQRKFELEDMWDAINSGSHLLLCAPRRVGKTSLMHKILDEPQDNYIPIYIDTESADSQAEFWKKIFNALTEEKFTSSLKNKAQLFADWLKGIKITSISIEGVEFGDGDVLDYKVAFKRLIKDLEQDKKLIIMIDEFAQTIENIIQYQDVQNALSLLKAHRELRQDTEFSQKVTFVYAGSIGLESVVAKIGASKHINDLNSIKVSPLIRAEAQQFVESLFANLSITSTAEVTNYLLDQIDWLIPFYIQLIVQEIKKLYRRAPNLDNSVVDQAINNALDNRNHFESWQSKLKTGLEKDEYLFAKEVLNKISNDTFINSLDINNMASKHKLDENNARENIQSLVYDGYINNNDDSKIYKFNSPILRMWWNKNVAN
ncbi:AAA family ATPase [Catenovulum agarivorans]|uniref:AAA family ATPase n=1 Tax=Catenovulum agarivorans TaxID=1172192 RepID=UPI00030CE5CD|nr:AAA family ATPase [Catenovulum agarivorans]